MHTTQPSQADMPDDLKARLAAAGATDPQSLEAALERDSQLKADLDAYVDANAEALEQASLAALVDQFAQVKDTQAMNAFWQQVPLEFEAPFIAAVEQVIAAASANGDQGTARHFGVRLAGLQRLREQPTPDQMPPAVQALIAFVQAPDEAAAREMFDRQRDLLQPLEAQAMLEQQLRSDDAAIQQRIVERAGLLRRLRQPVP